MGAEELGRLGAAQGAHFLPQCDCRIGVVTGAHRQLHADLIGFGFRRTAVGQLQRQFGRHRAARHGGRRAVRGDPDGQNPYRRCHGAGHALGGVIGQGVGDFVAHDLGEFRIRQFQLVKQPGVDRHAPACHAPGIDGFRVIDDRHAPLPVGGIGVQGDGLGNQSAGNGSYPVRQLGVVQQLVFLVQVADRAQVGLFRLDDGGIR